MEGETLRFESIEWLRNEMKNVIDYECRCGKHYSDFTSWWNHCVIKKHIDISQEFIDKFQEVLSK